MAVTVTLSGLDVTVTLSASGDTASPQNIITAGYGTLRGNKTIHLNAAYKVKLQIATGATYNDTEWVYEIPAGGSLRWNDTYGCGTWLSGYILNGSTYVKAKGATINYNNFDNSSGAGGRNIFYNSGIPSGFVAGTTHPTLKWNDVAWVEFGGSNAAAILAGSYIKYDCGRIIMDYSGDSAGANAGISGSYGNIETLLLYRCIGGVGVGYDTTKVVNVGKFEYFSLPATGTEVRMAFPNNVPFYGFAPLTYQVPATNTFICQNTTNTEILRDYTFPTGFDIPSRSKNYSANTRTYQRKVNISINDSTGTDLTNTTVYVTSGAEVLKNAVSSGDLDEYLQSVFLSWIGRSPATGSYILPLSYKDTEAQTAQFRKYGYQQQSVSYNVTEANYSQPIFMLTDDSLSGINEATAAAITTAGINWSTKTITPTSDLTYDQINARISYELAQTTNSAQADPRTILGNNLTLASGWSLVVNTGRTISVGTNITYLYAPTITLNGTGKITAVYATTAGTSTVLEINPPSDDYSLCVFKADGTTKYFASDVNAGSYYVYFTPAEAGTYYLAAEKYGQKRTADTLVLSGGNVWYNITDQEDVGITDNFATASAYTTLSTTSEIYDATAIFRLTETGIKLGQLVARDGLYLDFTTYNVKIKDDASAIVGVASGTITYKSIVVNESTKYNAMKATPPKTITPTDTEIINVLIEDANGDSQLSILGGDNLGYELWKVTTATATDDYATGTLLTTLADNTQPFRFIGISGYDIVGRDTSSGVRRRSSMLKGSYDQAFYVGNQIQLATDAPQLQENNDKLDELILKIDTQKDPLTLPQFIALK